MKALFSLLFLLLIPVVSALDECGFSVPSNLSCTITTPITSCTLIDIYRSDGTLLITDGAMSQIGSSSIYNYTINFTDPGTYQVDICQEASRSITVIDIDAIATSSSWWSYILQIFYQTLPGAW